MCEDIRQWSELALVWLKIISKGLINEVVIGIHGQALSVSF